MILFLFPYVVVHDNVESVKYKIIKSGHIRRDRMNRLVRDSIS